jgi:riboflavin synthase
MFTGIIEETGAIQSIVPGEKSIRLTIAANLTARGAKLGDSLAVNGCCLTIVKIKKRQLEFDLLLETWNLTNFHSLKTGSLVNLERSLAVGDRLHGHFVTGHIDGVGRIEIFEQRGADWLLQIRAPKEIRCYIVPKGAIAIDGISLTIAKVLKNSFQIWIIPHTYKITGLRDRAVDSLVNVEPDMLAKYVRGLLTDPKNPAIP